MSECYIGAFRFKHGPNAGVRIHVIQQKAQTPAVEVIQAAAKHVREFPITAIGIVAIDTEGGIYTDFACEKTSLDLLSGISHLKHRLHAGMCG